MFIENCEFRSDLFARKRRCEIPWKFSSTNLVRVLILDITKVA